MANQKCGFYRSPAGTGAYSNSCPANIMATPTTRQWGDGFSCFPDHIQPTEPALCEPHNQLVKGSQGHGRELVEQHQTKSEA